MIRPFQYDGITRDANGVARYGNLQPSLVHAFREAAEAHPDNEALVELGAGRMTYRQFWDAASHIAGGLRAAGIERGDRVAIRLPNGIPWCLAFFGIQLAGAVVVPVNTRFSEQEVEYVVNDSGSKYVFMPGERLPDGPPFAVEDLNLRDLSAIFYTSGTTGFPKGAMTSHENFLSNIETYKRISLRATDGGMRNLISVPLFHVTGCNSQFLVAAQVGAASVIMPQFDVQAFLHAIGDERITTITSVPAIYWLALNQPNFRDIDTRAVTRVSYGGAPMPPDLVLRIVEAFPNARVGNGFGLTETSSISTYLPHEFARTRPETVGFAAPVVDLRLVDVEGDVGELLIRGQNVVTGYWNKPEATAEAFADHWLHSGDLARIDGDGFVQIVDRKKDMVNRGGENVYCVEVENALAAHPAVFEVAVLGVPDEVMGEKVGAVIVPKPGQTIDIHELLAFAATLLADFKLPQYVVIRHEFLPRNPGGKILKKRLRETVNWGEQIRRMKK
ncbi:MAG TPA: AMP-binding protein [Bryobacteraceae bacterium]|nr:AMP-binding protein [Bryobacteraceae bacterium]